MPIIVKYLIIKAGLNQLIVNLEGVKGSNVTVQSRYCLNYKQREKLFVPKNYPVFAL